MAEAAKELEATRRGPLSAVPRMQSEMERLFRGAWPRMFDWPDLQSTFDTQLPAIDVLDREAEVCVRAELPGFKKNEIDVSVNDSTLTIKAESKTEKETREEDGDYYRREITRGYVARTVQLPAEVDGDSAKARLQDGMLEVTVPKVARSKRQHVKIES